MELQNILSKIDGEIKKNNLKSIKLDIKNLKFKVVGLKIHHGGITNLKKEENLSVLMLLIMLLKKGYAVKNIELEKTFPLGRQNSGRVDVFLSNGTSKYMIEVKSKKEFNQFTSLNDKKHHQLFTYAIQERDTDIISYYAFDFDLNEENFAWVNVRNLLEKSSNLDDLLDRWNKVFQTNNFILENSVFEVMQDIKKEENLKDLTEENVEKIFQRFLDILRIYSISDKPNAFNKIINLFIAKIRDEFNEDCEFRYTDEDENSHSVKGLHFQFIEGETDASFNNRLNKLFVEGMRAYLKKDVSEEYPPFDFIEVYDEETFLENTLILKELVDLLKEFKFKYNYKQKFLGDFFEKLLNTSLKQDEGQFFTPSPLVDFILDVIPLKNKIKENILNKENDFIPSVVDYACGSGHFLISYINKTQSIIDELNKEMLTHTHTKHILKKFQTRSFSKIGVTDELNKEELTRHIKNNLEQFYRNKFSWVNVNNVVGVDKDYRLSKTTKVSTFLNGDGEAEILNCSGVNKFNSDSYRDTAYKENNFDFLLSNPPYSIKGFKNNFYHQNIKAGDETFELLDDNIINLNSSEIEIFFVERMQQLLKVNGFGVILLHQSILNSKKYSVLRDYIYSHFQIKALMLLSDITFQGTTTSPVVLFVEKKESQVQTFDYKTLILMSPKYFSLKTKKAVEEKFLGYKFSNNKNKPTIEIIKNSGLDALKNIVFDFINSETKNKDIANNELVKIVKFNDILIDNSIFPKYEKNIKGKKISFYVDPIKDNVPNDQYDYVEIGSIKGNKIQGNNKKLKGFLCKKGDILVASLTPTKEKIIIADKKYRVSSAIYILRAKDKTKTKKIVKELKKEYVLKQMGAFLRGFKITYAKINEDDLLNFVKIVIT